MGAKRTSYPRFRRIEAPSRIELTGDDLAILRHLYRHRFMRSSDLMRLLDHRSAEKVSRRLARLYRAHLIDRPVSQIDSFRESGSQPLVYGLDNGGARALAKADGIEVASGDWTRRNRKFTRDNLDHTLATTRFMVGLELACRTRPGIEFIAPDEVSAVSRWRITLPWHGSRATVVVAPDAIFGLRATRADGRTLRSFYFVEVDRGSMTIVPSRAVRQSDVFLHRSSILRKLLAYAISHEERAYQDALGIPAARVLVLTTTLARASGMRTAAARFVLPHADVPAGLFLFGGATEGDPLAAPFAEAEGTVIRLAEELSR